VDFHRRESRDGKLGAIIVNDPENVRIALRMMGFEFRVNAFKDEEQVAQNGREIPFDDRAFNQLRERINQQFKFLPTLDAFKTATSNLATENPFHPVRDYLDSLAWDGVKRVDGWLTAYLNVKDSEYARAVGRIF